MLETIQTFIANNAVMLSASVLILAYIFIALERIPKVTIALIGAVVVILLNLVSQTKTVDGAINPHYYINFVDFNVIFLLVSMMIIVAITTRSGIFNWLANELLKFTKGRPVKILFMLGIFTAVVSALIDNVTTVILILPITFAIVKKLDINPIPYLIVEVFASNIGGTATLIGDPPNIIIGSAAGFSFMDFINELTGIVAIILLAVIFAMYLLFRKKLITTEEKMKSVMEIDNSKTIEDKPLMIRSLLVLVLVIAGFVLHDKLHLETSTVAMIGACALLLFEKPTEILRDVEWNAIFFFIGLFIIIGALEASGGIKLMAQWLIDVTQGSKAMTCGLVLWISGIASGIIDNIPYTATMAPLIAEIQRELGAAYAYPIWWCLSLGACLGGNLTIIGAAANVYVSENAANKGYPIGFLYFMKYGAICVFISLVLSSAYIYLRFLR